MNVHNESIWTYNYAISRQLFLTIFDFINDPQTRFISEMNACHVDNATAALGSNIARIMNQF